MLTYAELFAGAGGLSLALEAGGFHSIAHAEIEVNARAVLRHRWPTTRLDGDVTTLNGADYAGASVISGGSPCQDLSVAGKRAGLTGARSSLFYHQLRIWQESGAPYLLWENVYGAFSSNKGHDFAAVLGAIVGADLVAGGAVRPDKHGKLKWLRAGRAVGPQGVVAWRVSDLQHYGPPQRRVRVAVLGARHGAPDPGEILAVRESPCRHPAPRDQAREKLAASVGGGAEGGVIGIDQECNAQHEMMGTLNTGSKTGGGQYARVLAWDNELNASAEAHGPLLARGKSGGGRNGVIAFEPRYYLRDNKTGGAPSDVVKVDASIGKNGDAVPHVVAFSENQQGQTRLADVTQALANGGGKPGQGYAAVLAFQNTGQGWWNHTDTAQTLRTPCGGDATLANVVCTTGDTTHALTHEEADASEDGTGRGTPIVTYTDPGMEGWHQSDVSVSLCARDAKDARPVLVMATEQPRPRRLMPVECERLMSWPDEWTATGVDESGRQYALSDTARYRLCGNGVATAQFRWIAQRLHDALASRG